MAMTGRPVPARRGGPDRTAARRPGSAVRSAWVALVISILAALPVLAPHASPLAAQTRSISMDRFHADIEVREDGAIVVTEKLDIRFDGSWNGIERELSLQHRTAKGRRARLDLEVLGVTDEAGTELEVETSRSSDMRRLRIWVPDARDAVRTVVIRYEVSNVLRFFEARPDTVGFDELYWNVTGNDWTMPIRSASARIVLPPGVDGVQAWAYTGPAGSQAQDATIEIAGSEVHVRATRAFASGEGLTVSVTWPPGVVARPGMAARMREGVRYYWPLALPLLIGLLMYQLWKRHGRDPEKRAIVVQYEPPADLSPAEVGTLVDHKAEVHDITSTLVDLAVRGYIQIEERERKRTLGLRTKKEYHFHLIRPESAWDELRPHERLYLAGMFGASGGPGGLGVAVPAGQMMEFMSAAREASRAAKREGRRFDRRAFQREWLAAKSGTASDGTFPARLSSVELSALTNRFYVHLGPIRAAIYGRLIERGLYRRRPDHVLARYMAIAILLATMAVTFSIFNFAVGEVFAGTWPLLAGTLSSALIIGVFAFIMPARTEAGARAREFALGFREFLSRVESDRYRRMITGPEMFEQYLPFAMAFRVESRWARAFEGMLTTPPDWYRGSSPATAFDTMAFTRSLGAMYSAAGRSMSSSPSSSGSSGVSGSGGGGFSGGGSGGGGGGGF